MIDYQSTGLAGVRRRARPIALTSTELAPPASSNYLVTRGYREEMERDLYYFDYVDRNASDIVSAVSRSDLHVFQAATQNAVRETQKFKDRLHVDIAGLEVGRDVALELGPPATDGYTTHIPIKWRATDQAGLFPSMDASLEVTQLADEPPMSQLAIIGKYRPPMGVLGAVGDVVIGHRLAEASVRFFIADLASRLNETK